MLPFYPFVPRLVWASKPLENVGADFSIKLHEDPNSCTSITYPGDAYMEFGLLGVIVGMFVLGVFSEWLTDFATSTLNKRRLFLFVCVFPFAIDFEQDLFAYWTSVIRYLAILGAIGWLLYRPHRQPASVLFRSRVARARGGSA